MVEVWKPVVNYEGVYEVSDYGQVRRVGRATLKNNVNSTGYSTVCLSRNSVCKTKKVHSLVCEAFLGPRPNGYHVNHIDANKQHNSLDNLEYLPPRLNNLFAVQARYALDLIEPRSQERWKRKLKPEDVVHIRELSATMGSRRIGAIYGLHHQTVRNIVLRRIWKSVP